MKTVEFIPFLLSEKADIFSIRLDGKEQTETEEFLIEFKNTDSKPLKMDLDSILLSLKGISNVGVLESFFRPEGKFSDRICAIPLLTTPRNKSVFGTLRLYCIRVSDKLLILGNGGEKKSRTYEEDPSLAEKVRVLQQIDKVLSELEDGGRDIHSEIYNLTLQIA